MEMMKNCQYVKRLSSVDCPDSINVYDCNCNKTKTTTSVQPYG